jgi:preprotein translocase subunit SecA
MLNTLLTKVIGTKNERELKKIWPIVARIGEMEPELRKLTDQELRDKTAAFRERIRAGGGGADTAVTSGGCCTVCGCRRSARRSPKDGARRARQFDRWHDTRRRRMVEKSAGEGFWVG